MTITLSPDRHATIEERALRILRNVLPALRMPISAKRWSNRLSSGFTVKAFGAYLNVSWGRSAKPRKLRYDHLLGRYMTAAEMAAADRRYDSQMERAYTAAEAKAESDWREHMARIN